MWQDVFGVGCSKFVCDVLRLFGLEGWGEVEVEGETGRCDAGY